MRPMRTIPLALLLVVAALPARAQSTATLRGVDVYRSTILSEDALRAKFGSKLREFVTLRNVRRPAADEKAEEIRRAIELEVAKTPGVKSVTLTMSEYYTSVDHAIYATFEVVDAGDAGRLAFLPRPTRTLADPDGLLAAWKSYHETGTALSRQGRMSLERPACPGFYCSWGASTPELDALQKKIAAGADPREKDLRAVLAGDASDERRAAAVLVLSYGSRPEKVIEAAQLALKDSSHLVRGAGLQILADIANHRKDLRIDLDKILPLLDDPVSAVRGKAMGLLVPMTDDKAAFKRMMFSAPRLVALLKLRQPDNHDLAFTLLGMLSRQSYDGRDYAKWEAWASRAAAGAFSD